MSTNDYQLLCLSETMGPITHASRAEGNESLIAREPVVTARGLAWVPCLSGNAVRHRCIREPGMRWLIGEYGLRGLLTLPQLNFLLHGGNLTEGGGRENTRRIADFQYLFPLGRLVGGCLPDQILAGSLQVWRGSIVCEENRRYLEAVAPAATIPERLRPAEAFVSGCMYTRGDAAKTAADLLLPTAREVEVSSNLMIFSGESVIRGAVFLHGFTLPHVSLLEVGALLWSLALWQAAGGTIGGGAGRGHGRLKTSFYLDGVDPDQAIDAYLAHARSVKEEAVAWLHDVFAAKPPVTKAPGKGKGKAKATESSLLPTGDPA